MNAAKSDIDRSASAHAKEGPLSSWARSDDQLVARRGEHLAFKVAPLLTSRPHLALDLSIVAGDPPREEMVGHPGPFSGGRAPEFANCADGRAELYSPGERRRGGAQHQPPDDVTMASGQHLGNRSPHRIADDYYLAKGQLLYERGQVVGAAFDAKRRSTASLPAVPAQVGGYRVEVTAQVLERPVPIEGCRCHPTVQEQYGGAAGRSLNLPGPGGDAPGRGNDGAPRAGRGASRGALQLVRSDAASKGLTWQAMIDLTGEWSRGQSGRRTTGQQTGRDLAPLRWATDGVPGTSRSTPVPHALSRSAPTHWFDGDVSAASGPAPSSAVSACPTNPEHLWAPAHAAASRAMCAG